MGKLRTLIFPTREKPGTLRLTAFLLGLMVYFSVSDGLASSRPLSKSYVSARAYWHYLQSVRAWMDADLEKASEFMRVALVYDPGNTHIRSRWAHLEWVRTNKLSPRRLRRYIRRAPAKPSLYRLLGLEQWRRGKIKKAERSFRRSLKRIKAASSTEQKLIVRDFAFFLVSRGDFSQALGLVKNLELAGPEWMELKRTILFYQESARTPLCDSQLDGEHICRQGFAQDVKHADYRKPMSWSQSLEWGLVIVDARLGCDVSGKPDVCQVFESALRRFALPLNSLEKKDLF